MKVPEVFSGIAVNYLSEVKGKRLILMDEIGGMELGVPKFREALYQVLGGRFRASAS